MDLDDEELEATRKLHGVSKTIEVGDFIRDIFGRIGQIYQYDCGTYRTVKFGASSGEIVKHSKNILDLLQIGDIVEIIDVLNKEVVYIWDKEMLKTVREDIGNGLQLKSILTKEQYNANCYVVKE